MIKEELIDIDEKGKLANVTLTEEQKNKIKKKL